MTELKKSVAIFFILLVLAIIGTGIALSEEQPKQDQDQKEALQESAKEPQDELLKQPDETAIQEDRKKILKMLLQKDFRYSYFLSLNSPLVPFIQPPQTAQQPERPEQLEEAPPPPVLLTPLQKMELSEIERGFKGVVWSSNERKAIIEDSTGKGYIVTVGTPIGNQDGFVSAIFPDCIIIRQKVWDRSSKTFKDEDVVINLRKEAEAGKKAGK